MHRERVFRVGAASVLGIAAVVLTTSSVASAQTLDPQELCGPTNHSFTTDVDNPFFPLEPGQRLVLGGKDGPDQVGLEILVLRGTETFYGNIATVRVRETEWLDADGDGRIDRDEELIEVSENWFAQTEPSGTDPGGTVCYFGEFVEIYEGGEVVSNEGSWRADDPDADNAPGIFMPANPEVGMTFPQEVAPGVAEDEATIVSEGRTVRTPGGTFTDTIGARDFNPLDGSRSTKAYASGVGLIQDDKLLLLRH
jgi:hypothetical protein